MEIIILIIIIIIGVAIAKIINTASNQKAMSSYIRSIPGFNVTKEIMGSDGLTGIAYDDNQRKVCLLKKNGGAVSHRLFSYKDILASEILVDGNSITKTARGSQIGGALIGGLVLGPVGFLLGGLTGKKKSIDKINRIDLQIVANDTSSPRHIINFLAVQTMKSSSLYNNAIEQARQWHAIIEVLIKKADQEDEGSNGRNINNLPNTYSVSDELKKLSELRDAGVLTDSEFQLQKGKILDK